MKRKSFKAVSFKTVLSLALCLVLCAGVFAAPAFAAGTVVVVGGQADRSLLGGLPEATSGAVVVSGSASSGSAASGAAASAAVVSGGNVASAIQPDAPAANSGAQTVVGGQAGSLSNGLSAPEKAVVVGPDGSVTPVSVTQNNQAQNGTGIDAASSTFATAEANKVPDGIPTELFALLNKTRTENGLSTLKYSSALQSIADLRAQESAISFGHTRPDGSECSTAVTVDYQITGENLIQITTGYVTAELMMETWMNSPTHKYNLLLPAFTDMAVGVWETGGVTYVSLILVG